MFEIQLTNDEFRQWRASHGPNKKRPRHVLPGNPFQDQLLPAGVPFGLGGKHWMKSNAKRRWLVLHSKHYGIAVNLNGIVVIKGSDPGEFLLWIQPSGNAGTNSKNQLTMDQLANEWLLIVLLEAIERICARPSHAVVWRTPRGPTRLLQKAVDALEFRRSVFLSDEASCRSVYKTMPNEWPF